MGRAYRFAVVTVLVFFAATSHYIGVEMFQPGSDLYTLIDPATNPFIASGWRDDMYDVFSFYLPILVLFFATAWLFLSEYEAQTITRRTRR